jgi:hypothetical protein
MKTLNDYPVILSIQKILFLLILILAFNSCSKDSSENLENKIEAEIKYLNLGAGAAARHQGDITFLVKDGYGNRPSYEKYLVEVDEGSILNDDGIFRTSEFHVFWTPGKTVGKQIIKITPYEIGGFAPLEKYSINIAVNVKPGIGTFYKGGVIFYLDKTLDHGFICPVSDQSSGAEWGCIGINTSTDYRLSRWGLGDGFRNTLEIESICSTPGAAANLCANLTLNGYDDWFLPSQLELKEMFKNSRVINETALENNGNKFKEPIKALTHEWYWSSTSGRVENIELDGDIHHSGFGPEDRNRKNNVRAIRAF